MPPAARLNLPASLRSPSMTVATTAAPQRFRVQGWDPVLIVSQIVSLQALHYLVLSLVLPALVTIFSSSDLLQYEGGGTSIALAMDWRVFTGSTVSGIAASRKLGAGLVSLESARSATRGWTAAAAAAAGELDAASLSHGVVRVLEYDAFRGWAVALGWVIASMADIFFLYHIVRRPTHILDFSLTLVFVHLILTIYYSSSFPTSFFFWFVVGASSVVQIVLAEQLCVKREMRDGFSLGDVTPHLGVEMTPRFPDLELGQATGHGSKQSVSYARVPNEEDQV